jgi:zinc transport system substrate-binding protein
MRALVLLLLALGVWIPRGAAAGPEELSVLTTTLPIFSLVAAIAGDFATVENLVPPGIEPHDFQITGREIRKIRQTKIIFINGLRLEDWLDRYLNPKDTQAKIVVVSSGFESTVIDRVTPLLGSSSRDDFRFPNPHFWLDPTLAACAVTNILKSLQAADPSHATDFFQNAAKLSRQLSELDAEYTRELRPLQDRAFVTSHDFFAYAARRYHLKLAGVVETDAEVEPSLHYIRKLSSMLRREKVGVIFVEPRSSTRLIDQLCQDLGIVRKELDPIEVGDLTPAAYFDGMRRNLDKLKEGLSGK